MHDQPVGCGTELARRDRLPIKTNSAHVAGADDLLIGDTVPSRSALDALRQTISDPRTLMPSSRQDSPIAPSWVVGVVVYDRRLRQGQGPAAIINRKHCGEGAAIEVRCRVDFDLRGRFAEQVRARKHRVLAEFVDREGLAGVGVLLTGKQEGRGARGRCGVDWNFLLANAIFWTRRVSRCN